MNTKKFLKKYQLAYTVPSQPLELSQFLQEFNGFDFVYHLLSEYGGQVFNKGLFKIHTFAMARKWTQLLTQNYFQKELENTNLFCFASNWQGCMYCVNQPNNAITYFDPATCEFFSSSDTSLGNLFGAILVDGEYDIIFETYFEEAANYLRFDKLNYSQSIGHKQYLHLGGKDCVENFEITDTEVLWETQMQIAESL